MDKQRRTAPQNSSRPPAPRRRETREQRRKRVIRNRLIAAGILLVLIILVIVLIASCSKKKKNAPEVESIPVQTEELETETTAPVPVSIPNEKPVNLYTMNYGDMTCYKTSSISRSWTPYEDLESFGAFCSSEDSFPFENETQAHKDTWNSVSTDVKYKIGYELSFDVGGEHKVITILKPGDIENNPDLYMGDYPESEDYSGITGYLGVWVYDDLNQDGNFYIHITQAEVTDDTLLTSIKLRPTPQSEEVSNLVLKAFSYSSDQEFDADGHYIGNYAAQVAINKE